MKIPVWKNEGGSAAGKRRQATPVPPWGRRGLRMVAALAAVFTLAACGKPSTGKQANQPSVKQSAKQSSSSSQPAAPAPKRAPSAQEVIAMVLLSPDAGQYATPGSQLIKTKPKLVATAQHAEAIPGLPETASAYSLSNPVNNRYPIIVIDGAEAFLDAAESATDYATIRSEGMVVNIKTLWPNQFQNPNVKKLAQLITLADNPASSEAPKTVTAVFPTADAFLEYVQNEIKESGNGDQMTDFSVKESQTVTAVPEDAGDDTDARQVTMRYIVYFNNQPAMHREAQAVDDDGNYYWQIAESHFRKDDDTSQAIQAMMTD
ncbi:hypothetical protein ACFQ3L_02600 [Lacticaseibacillus jixianensis]|uniref:Uncharacterized protein n=1 Tax=Lacticaseibacillus jixianensis TaxID=2486012 RepID=A0ABW4B6W1_9LACO|nr:hypothetical protein [Lacticaseibacillus jixianensis]